MSRSLLQAYPHPPQSYTGRTGFQAGERDAGRGIAEKSRVLVVKRDRIEATSHCKPGFKPLSGHAVNRAARA